MFCNRLSAASRAAVTGSSAPSCARVPSSTTRLRFSMTCPSDGPTTGRRALPARAARRRGAVRLCGRAALLEALPASAARCGCGGRRREGDGFAVIENEPERQSRSRSSACARASCTRSRSRTGSSSAAATVDRDYAARREDAFIVAVNCGRGRRHLLLRLDGHRAEGRGGLRPRADRDPRRTSALLPGRGRQRARRRGARTSCRTPARADGADRAPPTRSSPAPPRPDGPRRSTPTGLTELLQRNLEHPRWDEVAERCLTCGNCTMVCPTCFCTTVEDVTDLAGERAPSAVQQLGLVLHASTTRYIHGGAVRPSGALALPPVDDAQARRPGATSSARSGCVGCGRCITWCPVGIDITEEAARDPRDRRRGGTRCRRLTSCSRRAPFFAGLDADQLELIAGCGSQRALRRRRRTCFREGDAGRHAST